MQFFRCGLHKYILLQLRVDIVHKLSTASTQMAPKANNPPKTSNKNKPSEIDPKFTNNNSAYIKIVSNGYGGYQKSIVLNGMSKSYIFNPGEGIQRGLASVSARIRNIDSIFMMRKSASSFVGLIGLFFSLQPEEEMQPYCNMHAPFNVLEIIREINYFMRIYKLNITQYNYETHAMLFEDENLYVRTVELRSNQDNGESKPKKSRCDDVNRIYAYQIELKMPFPKMSIDKLIALKVPAGKARAQLKKGEEVVLDDGRLIKPEEVLDHVAAEKIKIMILDCADEKYLNFVSNNEVINDDEICLYIHMANASVLNSPNYRNWMLSKKRAEHIVLDENYPNVNFLKVMKHQKKLNMIDTKIFPPLDEPLQRSFQILNDKLTKFEYEDQPHIVYGQTNQIVFLRPKRYLDSDKVFKLTDEANLLTELKNGLDDEGRKSFDETLQRVKREISQQRVANSGKNAYPITVFLGTGSSRPSLTRNLSGVLVKISDSANLLMDCGEGTLLQMKKLYACDKHEEELIKVKAIFVSHYHADHHTGICSIVSERHEAFRKRNLPYEKLILCIPRNLNRWLIAIDKYFDSHFLNSVSIIYNDILQMGAESGCKDADFLNCYRNLKSVLKMKTFETVPVDHAQHSHALVFETNDDDEPFKLVFSGDCRPSEMLAQRGQNCDLLIHESTFSDVYADDARKKKHSTVGEAVKVASMMKAKNTLLWHFSQRYAKIPHSDFIDLHSSVNISFDFMCVDRNDLMLLAKLNDLYKLMFCEDFKFVDEKEQRD